MPLSDDDLRALAVSPESARVERKRNERADLEEVCCAFANDIGGTGAPGVLFVGLEDDGRLAGLPIDDALMCRLADLRDRLDPRPPMEIRELAYAGSTLAAIVVAPSDAPPVRYQGRAWIRVGPTNRVAGPADERILLERAAASATTFDRRHCPRAMLTDLDLSWFEASYLPRLVSADVIAANGRSIEHKLASARLWDLRAGCPNNAAALVLAHDPLDLLPGAYVQFVRFAGEDRSSPVTDQARIGGPLHAQVAALEARLPYLVRVARRPLEGLRFEDRADYPVLAIREALLNALMHRTYDSNTPVKLYAYADRLEIQSPGSLFGVVTPQNFERATDYRNPVLADVFKTLGYVDRFGMGVARTRDEMRRNGNPPPEFEFEPQIVTVRLRAAPVPEPRLTIGDAEHTGTGTVIANAGEE